MYPEDQDISADFLTAKYNSTISYYGTGVQTIFFSNSLKGILEDITKYLEVGRVEALEPITIKRRD